MNLAEKVTIYFDLLKKEWERVFDEMTELNCECVMDWILE